MRVIRGVQRPLDVPKAVDYNGYQQIIRPSREMRAEA
jgi:hypothetical protein